MSIVTLEQAKQQLGISLDDTSDDDELQGYVDGITGAIENYKREVIERREMSEDVELCGRNKFRLWYAPVASLTSLVDVASGYQWDVSKLKAYDSGLVRVLPGGQAPRGLVTATYDAGYDPVPANYVRGALVILQHTWETQRGVAGVESGVVGEEEVHDLRHFYTFPRKAMEWLGSPRPVVG